MLPDILQSSPGATPYHGKSTLFRWLSTAHLSGTLAQLSGRWNSCDHGYGDTAARLLNVFLGAGA